MLTLCRNQTIALDEVSRGLTAAGYRRVAKVAEPGDWSRRGGIVDCFPEGFDAPVRIEWDDQTIHAIRSFYPETGQPFHDHQAVILLPAEGITHKRLRTQGWAIAAEAVPIEQFVDVEVGDLMVHVTHGIGRYRGLKKAKLGDRLVDHVALEYAEGDLLYIPIDEISLIQKYVGFEGHRPALSKLGSKMWERIKERAREGARSVAFELLSLQARRLSRPGFASKPDTEWQKELEGAFAYPETPGQLHAIAEVKADLEAARPMDRLLCGDVGYGKTEVALRAAFKVCMDNRQVAVLCPTTILAEQHAATFRERLKQFPVNVRMLSRFQSGAAQDQILKDLKAGQVDVIIGTHRLFSADVEFKNLGLLVVDEEQRFGVRHKEQLKRLRASIDVLTMSATPIPRTLYMALTGARSMSLIETPPQKRLPVKTIVSGVKDALVREAIQREMDRDGQVFAVYPWVRGVEKLTRHLQTLLPKARIQVAHGQMPSRALESAMLKFMRHEIDVLVSTSIIESGIDIPNANTLLVFRAESFGLADLYQLRGRVGRFTRQAYAYFFTEPAAALTRDAEKRLDALERFSGLGAGFKIALEDLQLRGAGNLLGTQQHGHICAVGFDLYCRLLKSEVERLQKDGSSLLTGSTPPCYIAPSQTT
ncbi:MAG: DEAD/DEAH box helicase [Candidatus Omnitrophica bacterium]|nr:DEAD/DEAH box helicase [Candidatus Omnitrophota bacterium]